MLPAMNALAERPDVLGGQGAGGTRRRRQVIDGALQIGLPWLAPASSSIASRSTLPSSVTSVAPPGRGPVIQPRVIDDRVVHVMHGDAETALTC